MIEHADLRLVNIDDVNLENREYHISFPDENSLVELLIDKTNIINPVTLLYSEPYIVIDGFRRLKYASRSGKSSVPAYILSISREEALTLSICQNLLRGLNLVEKAIAVAKMHKMGIPKEKILNMMDILSLGKSEKVKDLCLNIANEKPEIKNYFLEHSLSLKTISYFFKLKEPTRNKIISFLLGKSVTESSLREFFQIAVVSELKCGDKVFSELDFAETLEDAKKRLKKKAWPLLSDLEQEFAKVSSRMAFPPNVKVRMDPNFEKEELEISIKVKKKEEIELILTKLNSAIKRGDFDKLFELSSGKIC
ncbi:MAG: ParB N-terminal domain-containing protein [Deltaproteobacteria bacterium]|nr:ParB N-terminal domain-containing protein [Deltaproteobacteria bacterium]